MRNAIDRSATPAKKGQDEPFSDPVYFTTSQLCALTGLPIGTLKRLRSQGSVLAALPGQRGRGHSDLWAVEQALALAVARGLRSCGCVAVDAEAVLRYFWDFSAKDLERAFKAGRTHLVLVVTAQGTHCLPKLVSRNDILGNQHSNDQKVLAMHSGLKPSALDVQAIWRFLLEQAAEVGVELPEGGNKKPAQS
jgi:hypothetical protein